MYTPGRLGTSHLFFSAYKHVDTWEMEQSFECPQRLHDAIITSLWRQTTSWRQLGVNKTLFCVVCSLGCIPKYTVAKNMYEVVIVIISEKIDRVITALHCFIAVLSNPTSIVPAMPASSINRAVIKRFYW